MGTKAGSFLKSRGLTEQQVKDILSGSNGIIYDPVEGVFKLGGSLIEETVLSVDSHDFKIKSGIGEALNEFEFSNKGLHADLNNDNAYTFFNFNAGNLFFSNDYKSTGNTGSLFSMNNNSTQFLQYDENDNDKRSVLSINESNINISRVDGDNESFFILTESQSYLSHKFNDTFNSIALNESEYLLNHDTLSNTSSINMRSEEMKLSHIDKASRVNSVLNVNSANISLIHTNEIGLFNQLTVGEDITIEDGINSFGIRYKNDYSINGAQDSLWIPNWGAVIDYVNSNVGGSETNAFMNGIEEILTGAYGLGGALIQDTLIDVDSFKFKISSGQGVKDTLNEFSFDETGLHADLNNSSYYTYFNFNSANFYLNYTDKSTENSVAQMNMSTSNIGLYKWSLDHEKTGYATIADDRIYMTVNGNDYNTELNLNDNRANISQHNGSVFNNFDIDSSGFSLTTFGSATNALHIKTSGNILFDGVNNFGLSYNDDYSANGTQEDRWIPDWGAVKNYVDANSNSDSAGEVNAFINGIDEISTGAYGLGGNLIQDTVIGIEDYSLSFIGGNVGWIMNNNSFRTDFGSNTSFVQSEFGFEANIRNAVFSLNEDRLSYNNDAVSFLIERDNLSLKVDSGGVKIDQGEIALSLANSTTQLILNDHSFTTRFGSDTSIIQNELSYEATFNNTIFRFGEEEFSYANDSLRFLIERESLSVISGETNLFLNDFEISMRTESTSFQLDNSGLTFSNNQSIFAELANSNIEFSLTDDGNTRNNLRIGQDEIVLSRNDISSSSMKSITLNGSQILISDTESSLGMAYNDDYSANGTQEDRWIPDWGAVKAYVDNLINQQQV